MYWDILPEICLSILWHENALWGLRNLFTYLRGDHDIFYPLDGDHEIFTIMEHFNTPPPPHSIW